MLIGVPKEIKPNENRVALTPAGAQSLIQEGHEVMIETEAGTGSGFYDEAYKEAGAEIVSSANDIYDRAEMVMKVKEPLPPEYDLMKEDQIMFTFLHLAAEPELTKKLVERNVVGIAYETIEAHDGSLPLLTPMSEVAGRMSTQMGSRFLEKTNGGKGVLMGGVPGTKPAKVTVIGGGIVGTNAAKIALGMGAEVTILDIDPARLRYLDDLYYNRLGTLMSNSLNIEECVKESDLVIGAVLVPGAKAPKLVTEDMIKKMPEGSVVVDVAIDQGGSIETIDRVTTHDDPVYEKHGVLHYAVANMPGAVPRTSTIALTNVTLPYAIKIANKGWKKAVEEDEMLVPGVNTANGKLTYKPVANSLDLEYTPLDEIL
ncbi:alanine dehydrogenase [Natranaerobius thermophilus]|uniref:Alanine dehydrogenase n=1 Tax=Natranaerobius thermophilus (strain ATCC BAA-1301 / DSM 18059 / JW/NM-WN-LF) TaxID=457570 RepID=B2A502_NATTJ|nr:alanine dehydrogenase [Natranaerobius thermophilus]ACB85244.1 L-alanine dehydrogenase [Natranaerobius thermophilus JW/NM-WN-LF]